MIPTYLMKQVLQAQLIRDFAKVAPDMKLADAERLTDKFSAQDVEVYKLKTALAILSEPLGFTENGGPPEHLKQVDKATKWALDKVTENHGWVVIGPTATKIKDIKKEVENQQWK